MPTLNWSSTARALSLLVLMLAAASRPVQAQDPVLGPRVSPDLIRRASAGGRVRVIVQHTGLVQSEVALADPNDVMLQRAQIAGTREAVLAAMAPGSIAGVRRLATIPYFAADVSAAALSALERSAYVLAVREDLLLRPELVESVPLIGVPHAWSAGFSASGWAIAVLDSGVDGSHGFLAGKILSEACYSTTSPINSSVSLCPGGLSASLAPGSAAPCPAVISGCDHGTHVAGIAAGFGMGLAGVARDAGIIAIQVFSRFDSSSFCSPGAPPCALAYTSDVMMGLERVHLLRASFNIASATMSLGGGLFFSNCDGDPLKPPIDQLRAVEIATIVSSGNSGASNGMSTPACVSSAISVGSSTKSDTISSFSNRAPFLSLLAPGSSITSSIPGGGFAAKSGTSMAAPHVAGAWAVLKQRKPDASVDELLAVLRNSGQPLFDAASSVTFSRIRVHAALASLLAPRMSLDAPAGGSVTQPFTLAGWAIDQGVLSGTGVDTVHVWAYPNPGSGTAPVFVGAASYGGSRPDVGAAFGGQFTNSAFGLTVGGLNPGVYQFIAYAYSTVGQTFSNERSVTATIAASPRMAIESPSSHAVVNPHFAIAGWALDLAAAPGVGTGVDAVHVWAYPKPGSGMAPVFLGSADYGGARPDVADAYGPQFTGSAYALPVRGLSPGVWEIVSFMHSTVTSTFSDARRVTVTVSDLPRMNVDLPGAGASVTQPLVIAGWAIDRAAPSGTGIDAVHVWAFPASGGPPRFLGSCDYGGVRPDVGAVFGTRFAASGFSLTVPDLDAGSYFLVAFAHSSVTGLFTNARTVPVTVGPP